MSHRMKIESIVRQDPNATEAELAIVANIDRNNLEIKSIEKYSRRYESLHVKNSTQRRKLKLLRASGEEKQDREISDDINVLEYYVFITGNEITKVKQQLLDAKANGRQTAGHQIYLDELFGWQRKYERKLTKLRGILQ